MRALTRIFVGLASLTATMTAHAQVLPQVQLPGVQVPSLPAVEPVLRGAGETLRTLPTRAVRSRQLLERHRAVLDRDPRGELVVRAEVIALDITAAALAKARQADFLVKRTHELPELGVQITVLQTPAGWTARRGLAKLRKLDPAGTYDFNHVYLDSGGDAVGDAQPQTVRYVDEPAATGGDGPRVGLIDSGIDSGHEALRDHRLHEFGCGGARLASPHGTAVASLLVRAARARGTAPGIDLYAADVYCDSPTGGAVDTVAAAFGWMAREHVPVVNVSLVGPRNALLERAVGVLVSRGVLIVAAVGNDGPASPPLYPAAYAGVVGVTGVDARQRVLLEACRGRHVRLSAPGADIAAALAGSPEGYGVVRGTSFAAPIVSGLLARDLREPDTAVAGRALAVLTAQAVDLGAPGRDDVYGAGLVGAGLLTDGTLPTAIK
jgi:hypothetical protein